MKWLVNTGQKIKTTDNKTIEVWELRHQKDDAILSAWAKHIRNHYCSDNQIDYLRKGYGYSRAEYLSKIKFPDASNPPGPSIRSGDFAELIVADYVEFLLNYWVPRTRYADKTIRNESTKGCDIIGFKIIKSGRDSKSDTLAIFESKADLTGQKASSRLQDAVNDSSKDPTRKPESLNAIKQRLFDQQKFGEAEKIERFQNPVDRPYQETYGAVAVLSTPCFDGPTTSKTDTSKHPAAQTVALLVIHGGELMSLAHELYARAINEA
ncbi:DUF1837 domain-containing protein [Myxococcus xanthus]|nr:DUF1837 domain-containing protein [Myxococcus xanthus]